MADWYYSLNDNREGPVPLDTLRRLIAEGTVAQTELAWTDGMVEWKLISSLKVLLPDAQSSVPTPPSSPEPVIEKETPLIPVVERFLNPEPSRKPQRDWEPRPDPPTRRNRREDDRDDYDDGPRRKDGILPHRATTVFLLSQLGLILWAPLSFISPVLFGLSVPAFFMSKNDLKAMNEGRMDRSGETLTRAAFAMSITGIVLHSICTCGLSLWIVASVGRFIR